MATRRKPQTKKKTTRKKKAIKKKPTKKKVVKKKVEKKTKTTRKPRTKRTDTLPRSIDCVKCGHTSYLGAESMEKKIKKAGSVEMLFAEYRCRKCAKEQREKSAAIMKKRKEALGPKKPKISPTMQKYMDGNLWFQKSAEAIVSKKDMTPGDRQEEAKFLTARMCLMPQLVIDLKCAECPFFDVCQCTDQKGNLYKTMKKRKSRR